MRLLMEKPFSTVAVKMTLWPCLYIKSSPREFIYNEMLRHSFYTNDKKKEAATKDKLPFLC
ncbi:hypothetical protein [Paenibacillus tundrae]|nr:hypothetical protein [Paenibacillus tundrae]